MNKGLPSVPEDVQKRYDEILTKTSRCAFSLYSSKQSPYGWFQELSGLELKLPVCFSEQSPYSWFQELSGLLSGLELILPESYVEILKEAGRVRRPFQAQAFALVMLYRFLADYFTKIEHQTVDNVNSLEE